MTPVPSSNLTVAVLGGGVGGLRAAHELAERGYAVTVYERQSAFGGMARSMSAPRAPTTSCWRHGCRSRVPAGPTRSGSPGVRARLVLRAEDSSTRTVGRILLQLLYSILVPGGVFDRLLTATPTKAEVT